MMPDWTRCFSRCRFHGGARLLSTWGGCIAYTKANTKYRSMIMLIWTFLCWPGCSTEGVSDTNLSDIPSCCLAALCPVGLQRFRFQLIQHGKGITPPVSADLFATGWMFRWQIYLCMWPGPRRLGVREKAGPGAPAKPSFSAACKHWPQRPVAFA